MVEVADGDGDGDLLVELGDGEGDVELVALSVGGDELPDGDFAADSVVLGVEDGLALAVWLDEGEALDEADFDALGEVDLLPLPLPLLLAEPLGDADVLLLRGPLNAAVSVAFFGTDEHVDLAEFEVLAPTASAPLIRLPTMKNVTPVSMPIAAGRTISALTGPTSFRSARWAGSSLLPP